MYNRCGEINPSDPKILMKAIKGIHENNPKLLNWVCSCDQYYLIEYIRSIYSIYNLQQNINYPQICNNQTSFDITNTKPRLCEIRNVGPCDASESIQSGLCDPVSRLCLKSLTKHCSIYFQDFLSNTTDLGNIVSQVYAKVILQSIE
jgi:hypothetical protein